MDVVRFDRWARNLFARRSLLALLVASVADASAPASARRKRKKKRCKKSERACTTNKQCCKGLACTDAVCCRPDRVVSDCHEHCLCADDDTFCCAYEDDPPAACPGPASSPLHCCAAEDACGDFCCNPEFFACDRQKLTCTICKLPDINDCPTGGGTYVRIRRLR